MEFEEIKKWFFSTELINTEKNGTLFRADETVRLMNKFEELINLKDAEINVFNKANSEQQETIIRLRNELNKLKEKEIRGDRRIVELEHDKSVLKAELNQLKEKHKSDVKLFLETLDFHGYIDHDITKLDSLIEQYYKQKFEY